MTSRKARTERRAAERKAKKAEMKRQKAAALAGFVSQNAPEPLAPTPTPRTLANRANAQHSTGPTSTAGKLASSRNSLQHGLASGRVIVAGEDPSQFEALLHDLIAEHQPATPTEELLVQEMAESFWLTQRALRLQNECFTDTGVDEKRLALFLRYQTTHDRAFYKALTALLKIQKQRARDFKLGFVSQSAMQPAPEIGFVSQNAPDAQDFDSLSATEEPLEGGFVRQNSYSAAA